MAGNVGCRAIAEEVWVGPNGSLRLFGRLGICRALVRSGGLSPTSCWRLCILSNFVLYPTAISCAWTRIGRLLPARQYYLAGSNSHVICGREVPCSNGVSVCIVRGVVWGYLFCRLDRWIWIAVLRGEGIVGEVIIIGTVGPCRGLALGG